ncbi:SHOCT domain-containing protein [Salinirubellus sp. GCM10025818]|uniref:SHOCT domain-containing protein n=1 Tax=Salinirubellus TaxID=2162630 RepID=UPI0030D56A31
MTRNSSFTRPLLLVVAVIVLLPVLVMATMMPMMGMWGWGHVAEGGMWSGTGRWWTWLVMWFVPLLVVVGIGYLVYDGVRRTGTGGDDTALEELRVAYARGDLSDEEFEHRRERLRREE